MKTMQSLPSVSESGKKCYWILLAMVVLVGVSSGQTGGAGTLTDSTSTTTTSGYCTEKYTSNTWTYTDALGEAHKFPNATENIVFETCSSSCSGGRSKEGCFTGCGCAPTGETTQDEWSTDGQYYLQATGGNGTVSTLFDPQYKVVSVLYSPPGNESYNGFGDSTTNSTTTSYGQSFSFSEELTFTEGVPNILQGSESMGFTTTTSNSQAFTQTWGDATSVATNDNANTTYNPAKSDAINHNLDEFAIWLNPRVSVIPNGANPSSYSTGSQYTEGISTLVADVIVLPAETMEATPAGTSGVTTVPVAYLIPQAIALESGGNTYMPGLGAICKNNSLYLEQAASANPNVPTYCSQANQCGCKPSDFVGILQTDPLLNYNGTTLTASPYSGNTSPVTVTVSGGTVCGANPVSTSADCRYVIVPIEKGSTTPTFEPLSGSEQDTFTQSDGNTDAETIGGSIAYNVGVSLTSGIFFGSLKTSYSWQWKDSESVGSSTGTANSMSVTLKTSTASCDENVNIYEDTLYHTFVFQTPANNSCP